MHQVLAAIYNLNEIDRLHPPQVALFLVGSLWVLWHLQAEAEDECEDTASDAADVVSAMIGVEARHDHLKGLLQWVTLGCHLASKRWSKRRMCCFPSRKWAPRIRNSSDVRIVLCMWCVMVCLGVRGRGGVPI